MTRIWLGVMLLATSVGVALPQVVAAAGLAITDPVDGVTVTTASPTFSGTGTPGDTLTVNRVAGGVQTTLISMTIGPNGTFSGTLALVPDTQTIDYAEFSGNTSVGFVARNITFDTGGVLPPGDGCATCPPATSATPELDSLWLFGSGLSGLAGYTLMRLRGRRRDR